MAIIDSESSRSVRPLYPAFDIMTAFSQLETGRKMMLFDQLMCGRVNAYVNTMKSYWPDADDHDAKKLEMVLRSRLDRLKKFS